MTANVYETARCLNEFLLFHYGRPRDICPFDVLPRAALCFHRQIADRCLLPLRAQSPARALDLGCGVGRFTFELARIAGRALGVDSSRLFISAARQMRQSNQLTIAARDCGAHSLPVTVRLERSLRRADVEFQVADAFAFISAAGETFPLVAAINLLCRLPNPRPFLTELHRLVAPGGQLILATPLTWLEEFTPEREWMDAAMIHDILAPRFRLVRRRDLPFVIREHRRKYQLVISQVSAFVRRKS